MNNKKIFLLLGLATLLFATSCNDDDTETIYGNWVKSSSFPGAGRSDAVSFSINDTLYFGLGYNQYKTSGNKYFLDFYSYSGGTYWRKQDSFPGSQRSGAFSFAVNGKGYIGGGYYNDETENYYADVWEFDPTADSAKQWTRLPDFPDGSRTGAVAFVVGGKAYVAGGHYDYEGKQDCWSFDASSKTFTKLDANMGSKRYGAFAFVLGEGEKERAYVGGGYNGAYVSEFEIFDPKLEEWNEGSGAFVLRDLSLNKTTINDISHYDDPLDLRRLWATSFVLDGKGYLVAGSNGSVLRDCWEYDPDTDLWTEKSSFRNSMPSRYGAVSFVMKGVPYVMTGFTGSGYLDDMWYFEPNEEDDSY